MSRKKIFLIAVAVLVLCGGIVGLTIYQGNAHTTPVQMGAAVVQNLQATVSGTGQIKPKTYVNVGALVTGRITHLYAKEGDHVRKSEVVATIENIQQSATVLAQQDTIASASKDVTAAIANEKVAVANLENAKADLVQKQMDYQRAEALYKDALIARQDFDSKKAAYDVDVAKVAQMQAALAQAQAQTASSKAKLDSDEATLRSNDDELNRTISIAPFDGIVTNEPVREGETVVPGIQNTEGSTLMTLADMSVVTAEVKVDETDIASVELGQPAEVTVDALPGEVFHGHVTEVGDQALLRSSGVATSQSTSGTEEAKDFKVVVTLDNPSEELRPGLSTTAKIITATRQNVLVIPVQALTLRVPPVHTKPGAQKVDAAMEDANAPQTQPVQGVFVIRREGRRERAFFVPVQTGITGTTNIEVTGGLKPGDRIVTGPYRVLRTLKDGSQVKKQKETPVSDTDSSDSSTSAS
jgi:HlyD family secretion protein